MGFAEPNYISRKNDIFSAISQYYQNPMEVPKLEKVVISTCINIFKEDRKILDKVIEQLSVIAGQQAVPTYGRKSISAFKLKAGMKVGAKVTLRKSRMLYFIDKLLYVVIPKLHDFYGLTEASFDGKGNLSMGLKPSHLEVFPDFEEGTRVPFGVNIVFVTSAKTNQDGVRLLKKWNLPILGGTNGK